mmetsp:Transcript_21872/g.24447  ORF Transcript_21872/g.24447 Transcript_21872/m.24447 type:complete len:81 (+) Transcript_21872:185-427(+)
MSMYIHASERDVGVVFDSDFRVHSMTIDFDFRVSRSWNECGDVFILCQIKIRRRQSNTIFDNAKRFDTLVDTSSPHFFFL